jgi:exodeoxyribonuclease V alpha subunit
VSDGLLATDEQLTGEVLGVLYADPQGGFGVIELQPHDEPAGARCSGPLADLVEGQAVTLVGRWTRHQRYGPTFAATYYEQVAPSTAAGLRDFLASARFGAVPASSRERVLTAFGSAAGRIIEHEPHRLVAEAGLDEDEAAELNRAWTAGLALAELVRLVEPARWPMDAVRAAHARFGAEVTTIARDDPYTLLEVERVRFTHADALAKHLGIQPTDPRRLAAGARAAVIGARQREGHQHLPRERCEAAAARLLGVDRLVAADGVAAAVAAGELEVDRVGAAPGEPAPAVDGATRRPGGRGGGEHGDGADGEEVVSTPEAFAAERRLARGLATLASADRPRLTPYLEDLEPSDELTQGQRAAVRAVFSDPVSVLTGGPGTGKTRTVDEVVRAAERAGAEIALCAPTGRAAKRMEELVGRPATTIHRLLDARPTGDGGFAFRYGRDERLPHDLVVADEVSMCDTWLASRLVAAVDDGAHLLLVGDPAQLPSVGPGDVLRDLLRSAALPVTELTEIHRQAADSRIVGLANEVLAGEVAQLKGVDGDVFVAEERQRDRIVPRVVQAVAERAPGYFDVEVEQVQVLAPMYRGPAGVDALNAALKEALNPAADRPGVAGFNIGDRVMQTRNDPELDVANGDVGGVVDLDKREGTLRVAFPRGEVTCTSAQARDLTPAWAVTVHKAQGGEWPVVVLVLDRSHRPMLWRNLVYTAVTRAQRALIVVGQSEALHVAARQDRPSDRRTGLAWRLAAALGTRTAGGT